VLWWQRRHGRKARGGNEALILRSCQTKYLSARVIALAEQDGGQDTKRTSRSFLMEGWAVQVQDEQKVFEH